MSAIEIRPQPGPQAALLACPIEDIFYGGARGGGKTFGMLLDWIDHAITYGKFAIGVFFRRIFKNLEEVIEDAHRILPGFGFKWRAKDSTYVGVSGQVKGARLKFRHLMNAKDAEAYQGHAYTWVCFEEMTQWPDAVPIDMLRGTLRSAHGVKCVFRATGNPGGAGHNWVKARYISPAPRGYQPILDPIAQTHRVFIPALLEDNQILMSSNPAYERNLQLVGNATLVKAWRFGDWDIVAGGYFDDLWNPQRHIIAPFEIPGTWKRRRAFDWGSSKPAALGMYAISDGTQPASADRFFPRNSVVRFGEWYTCEKGPDGIVKPDTGLRLTNEELGYGIAERSRNYNWSGCVADPSIFIAAGGPSTYAQMNKAAMKLGRALNFTGADNARVPGWQTCRNYLEASLNEDYESPGFYVFENCTEFIRTVPVLQMDPTNPDDVDTKAEDHIGDEWRYMLQSLSVTGRSADGVSKIKVKR